MNSRPTGITWSAAPESTVKPFLIFTMPAILFLNVSAMLRGWSLVPVLLLLLIAKAEDELLQEVRVRSVEQARFYHIAIANYYEL